MESIPFSYGKIPEELNFTDRNKEIQYLKNNFGGSGQHDNNFTQKMG
jgi:hypothetical protein